MCLNIHLFGNGGFSQVIAPGLDRNINLLHQGTVTAVLIVECLGIEIFGSFRLTQLLSHIGNGLIYLTGCLFHHQLRCCVFHRIHQCIGGCRN